MHHCENDDASERGTDASEECNDARVLGLGFIGCKLCLYGCQLLSVLQLYD